MEPIQEESLDAWVTQHPYILTIKSPNDVTEGDTSIILHVIAQCANKDFTKVKGINANGLEVICQTLSAGSFQPVLGNSMSFIHVSLY
jgi:hypothetical protein